MAKIKKNDIFLAVHLSDKFISDKKLIKLFPFKNPTNKKELYERISFVGKQ